MRFFHKNLIGLALIAGLSWACSAKAEDFPRYPTIDYSKVSNPDLVKRGEYLAKTGDCIACHTDTPNHGTQFAGGYGIETPFGTFYSPNITSDEQTGIGKWSDKQFIDAVRHGDGPEGNYFPVFPYLYFSQMTDDDILAIKAYLFAVPKVSNVPPENRVPWPFSVRLAQYGWKMLFFYPYQGPYKPDPTKSAAWNRGAYLVEGPAHCGMCHSPLNALGAEERRYRYTGGFVQGFYAVDITSVGLKDYSIDQIVGVLHDGKTLSGKGQLAGPMLEAYNDSFKYLTLDDATAIATYLKTIVSEEPPKSDGAVTPETGPKIYNKYCSGCHANGGNGAPIFGNKADWQKIMQSGLDQVLQNAINGINSMPPMGNCTTCSQAQIRATAQYMIDTSLASAASNQPSDKDYFYGLPKLTPEQGKALYTAHCAVCHDKDAKEAIPNVPKMGDTKLWAQIFAQENFDDILDTVIHGQSMRGAAPHPLNGGCATCETSEIIAATKYLAQQNADGKYDFSLW